MTSHTSTISRQREIFLTARDMTDSAERARFIEEACRDDAALRQRIEEMLCADGTVDAFLEPEAVLNEIMPAAGDKIGYFGDYVLLEEIARGTSGVVFRARQMSLDRIVALKMLRENPMLSGEEGTHRLHAEAKSAAALDHPNIVPIYEVGVHAGQTYFSMKLVKGGTLQFRMAEYQQDVRKAVALMIKVARAMQHAHSQGLLHRDLKPGNILIDADGEPHIADFGLARKIGIESGLTMTGAAMGTPYYMSPEQARGGGRELTPATDIYSLGTMLYELIEGRRPFQSDDLLDLIKQVAEKPAPAARTPHRALAAIAMKCLEKSPTARYATAGELADALESWLRTEPVPAQRPTRPFPWRPVLAVAAVIALLVAGKMTWDFQRNLVLVTTLKDELDLPGTTGSGVSLREALRDVPENGQIRFSQAGKVVLSDALGSIHITRNVSIEGAETEIHAGPDIGRTLVIADKVKLHLANITLSGEAENVLIRGSVGAIENNGWLDAAGCRFLGNGGAGVGGAIVSQGDMTLRRCVFENNSSNMLGGALQIEGDKARVEIEDCLFIGNRAAGNGGSAINVSLLARDARVRLTRCTLTGNIWQPEARRQRKAAEKSGAALHILAGSVSLDHCIIAGNQGPDEDTRDVFGSFTQTGPNFIGGDPKDASAGLGASVK